VEYYDQLARLTGLETDGTSRPAYWAKLTKELIYDYLPSSVYGEIKRCQSETGNWIKLHQFLSEDGVIMLRKHQEIVLEFMKASSSIEETKRMLSQRASGNYQMRLLDAPTNASIRKAKAKKLPLIDS
jgi:hypothetical protein